MADPGEGPLGPALPPFSRGEGGGLIMSPFGNFNLARQELKKVALKALYKLRKEMRNHFRENQYKINDEVI